MKIIVTGATGLVGAEVLRQAILDETIEEITAIVRRPLTLQHPKIKTIIHQNFLDYSTLSDVFKQHDAFLWCLGISQSQVSKEEYQTITYEYTIEAAKTVLNVNPEMTFLFLSGMGADSTEKSKTLFAQVKGKTENGLLKMSFKKLFIVRPGGIKPIHKNPNTAFSNKIMIPFFPILELLYPEMVISSVQLAKVIVHIAKNGSEKQLMENTFLKKIAKNL
ncbi:MAG: NAD(P)H-binding protein [Bacteroidota bacterium]